MGIKSVVNGRGLGQPWGKAPAELVARRVHREWENSREKNDALSGIFKLQAIEHCHEKRFL